MAIPRKIIRELDAEKENARKTMSFADYNEWSKDYWERLNKISHYYTFTPYNLDHWREKKITITDKRRITANEQSECKYVLMDDLGNTVERNYNMVDGNYWFYNATTDIVIAIEAYSMWWAAHKADEILGRQQEQLELL